jgi:hypothetical protein
MDSFLGAEIQKNEQARPYDLQHHNLVLYYCAILSYRKELRKNVALHDKDKNYSLKTKLGAVLRPNS